MWFATYEGVGVLGNVEEHSLWAVNLFATGIFASPFLF